MTIGKKRARLDILGEPETVKLLTSGTNPRPFLYGRGS